MERNLFIRMRHECRRVFGVTLAAIRLHRVESLSRDGVEFVLKRRTLLSRVLIPAGNLFLKMTGSCVIVLPSVRWLEWELTVNAATRRNLVTLEPTAKGTALLCRRVPGTPLRQILVDRDCSLERKLKAIGWSLSSLHDLQAITADWGEGVHQSISHGDATIHNVIVDVDQRTACWIDFDTRHLPSLPELDRHTDDIRCLISSAANCLPLTSFPNLAETLAASQFDALVLSHFRRRVVNEWIHPTTDQLAQAPLKWGEALALREALLRSLPSAE